jgi:hypothetical protein
MDDVSIFGGGQHREDRIMAALYRIEQKVDQIMSEDATIAAEATAEEADIQAISGALSSIQDLLAALRGQAAGSLSAATLAAAAQVRTDLGNLATAAQTDLAADQPPPPPGC